MSLRACVWAMSCSLAHAHAAEPPPTVADGEARRPMPLPASGIPPLPELIEAAVAYNRVSPAAQEAAVARARWAGATPEIALKAAWGDEDGLRSVARFESLSPEPVSYTYDRDDGFELRAEARWTPGALIFSDQEPQLLREGRLLGVRREAVILAVVEAWSRRRQAQIKIQTAPEEARPGLAVEIGALTAQLEGLTGEALQRRARR